MLLADSIMPVVVEREMVASESLRLPLLPAVATVEGLPQRDAERLEGALAPCAAGIRGDIGADDAVVALKRLKGWSGGGGGREALLNIAPLFLSFAFAEALWVFCFFAAGFFFLLLCPEPKGIDGGHRHGVIRQSQPHGHAHST